MLDIQKKLILMKFDRVYYKSQRLNLILVHGGPI